MRPVFVLGVARTGSKLYQHLLTQHTQIDIAPELHFLLASVHAFQKRDFCDVVSSELEYPLGKEQIPQLLDLLYSGRLNGTFWHREPDGEQQSGIGAVDRNDLEGMLRCHGLSWRGIMTSLLLSHADARDKSRPGAKFPVNIARYATLLRWYPDAQVIHIVRHPSAILASMIAKDRRNRDGLYGFRSVARLRRLLYLVHQYRWAGRLHAEYGGSSDYLMVRFDRLVTEPDPTIGRIFRFVKSEGSAEGEIKPPIVDSSFRETGGHGWDEGAVSRWRDHLPAALAAIVERALVEEMASFGY